MRTIWVYRDGELVDKRFAEPLHPRFADAPMVIGDTMEPTLNHADGRRYDSKRAYERAVRAAGCEIIGNEKPSSYLGKPKPMRDPGYDLKEAFEKIEARSPSMRRKAKRGRS